MYLNITIYLHFDIFEYYCTGCTDFMLHGIEINNYVYVILTNLIYDFRVMSELLFPCITFWSNISSGVTKVPLP